MSRKLGGFLPLELPIGQVPRGDSVWDHWTGPGVQVVTADTARGVLSRIVRGLESPRVWFPSFICPEFPAAAGSAEVRYYPINKFLAPDVDVLRADIRAGDTVVGIDYFGTLAPEALRALAAERTDVHWIEDRAQALDPGPAWGDWVIYSPRKLFGVPDGGVGVCRNAEKTIPVRACVKDHARLMLRLAPLLARLEDSSEADNDAWYTMFRTAEMLPESTSGIAMSELSQAILKAMPIDPIREKRLKNARVLHQGVPPPCRIMHNAPDRPLLGYPIVLESDRDAVAGALRRKNIFCAVHWRALPSGVPSDAAAHRLAQFVLTLPCDQRYGTSQMDWILEVLREAHWGFDASQSDGH